jgi:hypothetical protein
MFCVACKHGGGDFVEVQEEREQAETQGRALGVAAVDKARLLTLKEDALQFARSQNVRLEEQLHLCMACRCAYMRTLREC